MADMKGMKVRATVRGVKVVQALGGATVGSTDAGNL
jgi:hypothetical protein